MSELQLLLDELSAAQADEQLQVAAARDAELLRQKAAAQVLDLTTRVIQLRGSEQPFVYGGVLYMLSGGRIAKADVATITLPEGAQP